MNNALRIIFGALIKFTSLSSAEDFPAGTKPHIYIADSAGLRSKLATYYAMKSKKACLLVTFEEYAQNKAFRTVNKKRIIAANGGIDTEWFHSALRRKKTAKAFFFFLIMTIVL